MTTRDRTIADVPGSEPVDGEARAWVFSLQRSAGGVPKLPLREAAVTAEGLDGDVQQDKVHHGGPERALCLYSLERILELQQEGHLVYPGSLGENVTLVGLDWAAIVPGVRLRLGEVVVEISDYAVPCRTIMRSFADLRYGRISQKTHPGFSRVYARVVAGGVIRVADAVAVTTPRQGEAVEGSGAAV